MECFDFDALPNRAGMGSTKWEALTETERAKGALPMWVADMDFGPTPCIAEALKRAVSDGVYGYTDATDAYLSAVCAWMWRRHGFAAEKEWIVPQNGVTAAISICVRSFTEPGDRVLMQPPIYPPFIHLTQANGREPVYSPLHQETDGRYRMDLDDLARKAADPRVKLMLLCSPHNPTGRVWTEAELSAVAEICHQNDVIVVSDEIHFDLTLGARHTVFGKVAGDLFDRCIFLTAPSKTFNIAGLQLSNTIIPDKALREKYSARKRADGQENPSFFGYHALLSAYTEGDAWLDATRAYVRDNFALLKSWLDAHLPAIRLTPSEATYLAWLDWRALGIPHDDLCRLLRERAGVYLTDGRAFGIGGEGFLRMNLALPRAALQTALDRIEAVVKAL